MHIVIIWQRFLPYHIARLRHAKKVLGELGHTLTAVEVASRDASYRLIPSVPDNKFERTCCFPGSSYNDHRAAAIHRKVVDVLESLNPDVVFAPATAFPEGMAALSYRLKSSSRSIIMDDVWEWSDQRNAVIRGIKRIIHQNADGAFIPAVSHRDYYVKLGFPAERIFVGVDVIDNDYYAARADKARLDEVRIRHVRNLPQNYFLFVGRFLPRKGLETLLAAYKRYRQKAGDESWDLVLIGDGDYLERIRPDKKTTPGLHFVGAKLGDDLCEYYGLARALIVPSDIDPWGLVVNEALASGLPVIVSRGCGSARTLVAESENGWSFEPGNTDELSILLHRISLLSTSTRLKMSKKSREIIANWSLERFASGLVEAAEATRRSPGGCIDDLLTRLWKGRVRVT